MAARCTIVQAQEIVEPGELDPNDVHVPGVFVDVIVHVPKDAELPRSGAPPILTASPPSDAPRMKRSASPAEQIAENIGRDIGEGWYVNLGVGMPLLAAKYVAPEKYVTMHMENGILGAGGPPEVPDPDLTDAGGQPVTLRDGARDLRLRPVVRDRARRLPRPHRARRAPGLAANGDLANWYMPRGQTGVGGAMDLVQGAKRVWVAMEHTDRNGNPKILNECTFTLTGPGVVKRIYTELGVFSLESGPLELIGLAPGVIVDYVRERTEPSFSVREGVGV